MYVKVKSCDTSEEPASACILCYDNPSDEGTSFEIPLIRWRRYLMVCGEELILSRMTLIIAEDSSQLSHLVYHGTCLSKVEENRRVVRFHSACGSSFEIMFDAYAKLNERVLQASMGQRLKEIPTWSGSYFSMAYNIFFSEKTGEVPGRDFVNGYIGCLSIVLAQTTTLFLSVLKSGTLISEVHIDTEGDPNFHCDDVSNAFYAWWPIVKPRVLRTWLQEISAKEVVQVSNFKHLLPTQAGFVKVWLSPGTDPQQENTICTFRTSHGSSSTFNAYERRSSVQPKEEGMYVDQEDLVLNGLFVISSGKERTGYNGASNFGCYLDNAYAYPQLIPAVQFSKHLIVRASDSETYLAKFYKSTPETASDEFKEKLKMVWRMSLNNLYALMKLWKEVGMHETTS